MAQMESKPRAALRSLVGLLFVLTGSLKLLVFGPAKVAEFFAAAKIPLPELNAVFVPSIEVVCGLGLLLGAFVGVFAKLTRVFALVLAGDMAVAIVTVGIGAATGHPVIVNGKAFADEPWRLPLEAGLLLVLLFFLWRPRAEKKS